jgi:hypothetical protein
MIARVGVEGKAGPGRPTPNHLKKPSGRRK